jgi:hypothetical protein
MSAESAFALEALGIANRLGGDEFLEQQHQRHSNGQCCGACDFCLAETDEWLRAQPLSAGYPESIADLVSLSGSLRPASTSY